MRYGRKRAAAVAAASLMALAGAGAGAASAKMIKLPTVLQEIQQQKAMAGHMHAIYPKAPPCPESGLLPPIPGGVIGLSNCGLPEFPATTLPELGPMAYWGGKVQVHPKEFLIFWGWGQSGAFPGKTCSPESIAEGSVTPVTLACDPDGAGKYMADFIQQMGSTNWAEVQDQYFQTDSAGKQTYVDESSKNLLAGMWTDDSVPSDFEKTLGSNPAGPTNTYTLFAQEATRALQHFESTGQLNPADVADANFIIAQPPGYTDPNALSTGYCAFHDFTEPQSPGNFYYRTSGIQNDISYTNMPYTLAINFGGQNVCAADSVNSHADGGDLDTFSIALGHEIQETATDPGAESIVGNATTSSETYYGGWYDPLDANENGDKCAYVGTPLNQIAGVSNLPGEPSVFPIPGAIGNITGNAGGRFAVQSLWSNAAAGGAGYCAGITSTDLPGPLAGEPPYSNETLLGLGKQALALGAKAKATHGSKHGSKHHSTKRHSSKGHSGKGHSAKGHATRRA